MSSNRIIIAYLVIVAIYGAGAWAVSYLPRQYASLWISSGLGFALFTILGFKVRPFFKRARKEGYLSEPLEAEWPGWAYRLLQICTWGAFLAILYLWTSRLVEDLNLQDSYLLGALAGYVFSGFLTPRAMEMNHERTR